MLKEENVSFFLSFLLNFHVNVFFGLRNNNNSNNNNNMEICKAPTLRLKALNMNSVTHIRYVEMEMSLATKT